jgi:predicted AlkP superfamily pyrophosphatase or phosphodiesterase
MNQSIPNRLARKAFLLALALLFTSAGCTAAPRHVLIVVMDGLRRDQITPEQMPTLAALAKSGTFFSAHHPVYPSSTQVNATALATGTKPETSDIMGNREYRPDLELLHPIDMNDQYFAWKSDTSTKGGWMHSPTLPEIARANGVKTVIAGTKAVALLWDRSYQNRSADQPTLFEGKSIPSATLDKIIADEGPFPSGVDWKYSVNTARDIWTTRALTEKLWADEVPALSVLWLYEPDFSQHGTGVGSKNAKLAYKSSDDRLATVLATLDKKGLRESTDIIIASDHGCSTISSKIDPADLLRKAGFKAEGTYHKTPEKGNIIVTGLGGSDTFYIVGHDETVRQKLISFLQTSDWAGVIFTKDGAEGTFKLSDVAIDSPDAPDVVVALRWKDEISQYGTPGTVICDGMDKGQGMHVSLSRYDMANTLIAAGPDFKKGWVDKLPSGNFDVAPTVAHILGLKLERPMDGRVLTEALANAPAAEAQPQTTTLKTERKIGDKTWRQYLRVTTLDGRSYYDEGNAGAPPEK